MNTMPDLPLVESADKVFLALGQTLYACQLFEGTMLEMMATADEILDGTGDGKQFFMSLESLSRKTLGQLIELLRKKVELRPDIEDQLTAGLEARNYIVHRFAKDVGEALKTEREILTHQKSIYEKCFLVLQAQDVAIAVLQAFGRYHKEASENLARLTKILHTMGQGGMDASH